jgi:hypothetical protein
MDDMDKRIESLDWATAAAELDLGGVTVLPGLLTPEQCKALTAAYDDSALFRSKVVMARHGYGRGEYQYFAYPLPPVVQTLRDGLYPHLAPIANHWHERMGLPARFSGRHADFVQRYAEAGQHRPTPLLLRYQAGDYNCLHQDLYGEHVFPLQLVVLLSNPDGEFEGGEFVLTEQRPRMQSRATVVGLRQGDAAVFAVNDRPVRGARGDYRVKMRHGVGTVAQGRRHTLGVIFHDAT